MPLFDTDDGLVVTQEGRDARARMADQSFVFNGCDKARIVAIYKDAVADARKVFEPRWAAVRGPNLHATELANLLQEVTLHWMQLYLGNRLPAQMTAADWAHPRTLRLIEKHVGRSWPPGSKEAIALCAALADLSPESWSKWKAADERALNQ